MRCTAFGNRGARCAMFERPGRIVLIGIWLCFGVAPIVRAAAPTAADEAKRKLNYQTIQQLCHQFEQVTPPPPPIEQVMVGTLDASTGVFTWGPKIQRELI